MVGLIIVLFWLLLGIVSLFWTPYPPNSSLFDQNLMPNTINWLGTDHLGRDILSRLMAGTQVILLKTRLPGDANIVIPGGVAIWGVVGALVLGAMLGLNAAYRGGWWDQITMQILDAMVAFPAIVLYLVIITAFEQGDVVVIFAITVTGTPGIARLVRSLALDIKTRDYIRAAETRGETASWIMFREILPNAARPDPGRCHAACRLRHLRHRYARLPGHRSTAPGPGLGQHGQRRPPLHLRLSLGRDSAVGCHCLAGHRIEPVCRRHARRVDAVSEVKTHHE